MKKLQQKSWNRKKLTGRPWQAQAAPETPPTSAAYTASGGGFNDVLNR